MIFLPQKMLEEKSKIHIVVMQVGNESLPYSGTKRKKKKWFESDLGSRAACSWGLIGVGHEEEDDRQIGAGVGDESSV